MKEFATNDKAHFDYEILETIEAGLVLKGYEVKSIKTGRASLRGAYVKVINGQPVLIGANIAPYQPANMPESYVPDASRSLLLAKKEIDGLVSLQKAQGLTLIPLKIYAKKNKLKLLIGIARGKKKHDKRESIKKREFERKEKAQY